MNIQFYLVVRLSKLSTCQIILKCYWKYSQIPIRFLAEYSRIFNIFRACSFTGLLVFWAYWKRTARIANIPDNWTVFNYSFWNVNKPKLQNKCIIINKIGRYWFVIKLHGKLLLEKLVNLVDPKALSINGVNRRGLTIWARLSVISWVSLVEAQVIVLSTKTRKENNWINIFV